MSAQVQSGPDGCPAAVLPFLTEVSRWWNIGINDIKWRWLERPAKHGEDADIAADIDDHDDTQPTATLDQLQLPIIVTLTVFKDAIAVRKREVCIEIELLKIKIASATASTKSGLQWLKLAKFGHLRTDKMCLRHDANVLSISGAEGDYDGEVVSVDAAISLLRAAGILALVYTSPSHVEDAPRWRVLCPTSTELPPDQRAKLVSRLNGVLGGILASESWTLSQSYYYGSVNSNPSHRVEIVYGTPIDLLPELDVAAIGKPGTSKPTNQRPPPPACGEPAADTRYEAFCSRVLDTLRREAVDGQKHFALFRFAKTLGGIQQRAGFSDDTAVQWLLGCLPNTVENWRQAERDARDGLARGRAQPLTLDDRPRDPPVAPDDPRRKALAAAAMRMMALSPPDTTLTAAAYRYNEEQPGGPLPTGVVDSILRWARTKHAAEHADAR